MPHPNAKRKAIKYLVVVCKSYYQRGGQVGKLQQRNKCSQIEGPLYWKIGINEILNFWDKIFLLYHFGIFIVSIGIWLHCLFDFNFR